MNFYIRGVGTGNKGAYLMMRTISKKLKLEANINKVGVDLSAGSYWELLNLDLNIVPLKVNKRVNTSISICDILRKINYFGFLEILGIDFLPEEEIDVVLDASGYQYGGPWGEQKLIYTLREVERWKNQSKKVIFMPQAFGPFETDIEKESVKKLTEYADLIFAREDTSYINITSITGKKYNVKIAPDFTELLANSERKYNEKITIIPNFKMIDNTNMGYESYLNFLGDIINISLELGLEVVLIPHEEGKDLKIVKDLKKLNQEIKIKVETEVEKIQEVLSDSKIIFSSRFHGLVNALHLGIPVIGTSWSFKYEELFDYYGLRSYLLDTGLKKQDIKDKIIELNNNQVQKEIRIKIKEKNIERKKEVDLMWDLIIQEVNK